MHYPDCRGLLNKSIKLLPMFPHWLSFRVCEISNSIQNVRNPKRRNPLEHLKKKQTTAKNSKSLFLLSPQNPNFADTEKRKKIWIIYRG